MRKLGASQVALFAGAVALALILGALAFQYIGGYPPCEMCHWQRWPHITAALVGLLGVAAIEAGLLPRQAALSVALLTLTLVALSGAIGVFHAGVEWKFWPGPPSCTSAYVPGQVVDLTNMGHVPMCDRAAWRLFGISMAGYNAVISLGTAAIGAYVLAMRRR
jgi:disulfide bond formation protein DsbB